METLTLDQKEYVKAKSAARELGYTSDYIGQLCRAGKIDAKLIGRSWYVDVAELKAHKKTRYGEKGTKSIKVRVDKNSGSDVPAHVDIHTLAPVGGHSSGSSNIKDRVYWNAPNYDADGSPLIPEVSKNFKTKGGINITVKPTDAEELAVKSDPGETYKMSATKLPTVRLNGVLKVSAIEDSYENDLRDSEASSGGSKSTPSTPLRNPRGAISMKRVMVKPHTELKNGMLAKDTTKPENAQPSTKPLSRFEKRVQAKLEAEALIESSELSKSNNLKDKGKPSNKIEPAKPRQASGEEKAGMITQVPLMPYVSTAIVLASFTLVLLFGINAVVSFDQIRSEETFSFNLANITNLLQRE